MCSGSQWVSCVDQEFGGRPGYTPRLWKQIFSFQRFAATWRRKDLQTLNLAVDISKQETSGCSRPACQEAKQPQMFRLRFAPFNMKSLSSIGEPQQIQLFFSPPIKIMPWYIRPVLASFVRAQAAKAISACSDLRISISEELHAKANQGIF